jgi:hypothetical protein
MNRHLPMACALAFGLAMTAAPEQAHAFKEHWHKAITFSALSFLDEQVLNTLLMVHDDLDKPSHLETAGVDKLHFNDCDFEGATTNLNELYASAIAGGQGAASLQIKWPEFGTVLHTAQDFYAHSNWVDLAQTALVDSGLGDWTVIHPYSVVAPGIVAIIGEQAGVTLSRQKGARVVSVDFSDGRAGARGLISGAAYFKKQCPKQVAIGHWDSDVEQGGLAKDYPCRDATFMKACTLGLRQTLNEWCRLVDKVTKKYAEAGKAAVMSAVQTERRAEAEQLCVERPYLRQDFAGACSCGS